MQAAERLPVLPPLLDDGWSVVHSETLAERPARRRDWNDLPLSAPVRRLLREAAPAGLYEHQHLAVASLLRGDDVCIATGTASGKSLVFQTTALGRLANDPGARVLAIYPMVALAHEQEDRWRAAVAASGINADVGRIDGKVPTSMRLNLLQRSRILIVTPDVMHAWLLANVGQASVRRFLEQLALIVVDEVHTYTGVFGSNSAFLFRRLQHLAALVGGRAQFIGASATIAEPEQHLSKLFGRDFELVGPESDSSPKQTIEITMLQPREDEDLLSAVASALRHLVEADRRFIAFVDSRKQTEHIGAILARDHDRPDEADGEEEGADEAEAIVHDPADRLENLAVLPYRAGYEEQDRKRIQERLTDGRLRGVVSTSALELGIDIPHLDTAVLVGVPRSATSLHQRIGRIGRHRSGEVLAVNRGDVYDEAVFAHPERLLKRPLAEGALYLENQRIQYIHTLCLARAGGEHEQIAGAKERPFESSVPWPGGFVDLCEQEQRGDVPRELQSMKGEAGDDPNHVFPLRDVESQFVVELKRGPSVHGLGSLSYGQLLREAYPGAVYRYLTRSYRIYRVDVRGRKALAREEKSYTTRPTVLPTQVYPNLSQEDDVYRARQAGDLLTIECNVQVREALCGYRERRGPNEFTITYPPDGGGIFFRQPYFSRTYFTSAAIVSHPVLEGQGVDLEGLAVALYEAFLLLVPFERRDLAIAIDRFRLDRGPVVKDRRFLALHDLTYGSLRLSGRLFDDGILPVVLEHAVELADDEAVPGLNEATVAAVRVMANDSVGSSDQLMFEAEGVRTSSEDDRIEVIKPGSRGVNLKRDNEEFIVADVFFSPRNGELSYRGFTESNTRAGLRDVLPISAVQPVPGESVMALYDLGTGELIADEVDDTVS